MTDYIAVSDTQRIAVDFDFNAECPRSDWEMLTGFVKIPGQGDSGRSDVPAVHDALVPIEAARFHFYGHAGFVFRDSFNNRVRRCGSYGLTEETTVRWALLFHSLTLEWDDEHGGFWFVVPEKLRENWPELVQGSAEYITKEREVIEQEQRIYERWAEGDVYTVSLEELVKYVRITGDEIERDFTLDQWELVDSISGCYLDTDYTTLQVANEHFGVSFGAA